MSARPGTPESSESEILPGTAPDGTESVDRPVHWVVRMNHRNRTVAFLIGFAALGLHLHAENGSAVIWVVLAVQFLIYPHLAYWRARRAARPMDAELQHVNFDSATFGFWPGLFGFPLWITFIFLVGSLVNPAAFRGMPGLLRGLASFVIGAAAGLAVGGGGFAPETSVPVTLLCIFSVLHYLVNVGLSVYRRSIELHEARTELRAREAELSRQLEEIRRLEVELREQASRDELTGLYNRRFLESALAHEWSRASRNTTPVAIMVIDVDHFKRINDTHGHDGGDAVLVALAKHFMETLRAHDVVCRYGGEEFLVVLPEMGLQAARNRAEQLRLSWESRFVEHAGLRIHSTLSIGIAVFPQNGSNAEQLVKAADRALYQAKALGRNQVVSAPPDH